MSGWVEERNKGKRMKKEEEILMEGRRKKINSLNFYLNLIGINEIYPGGNKKN